MDHRQILRWAVIVGAIWMAERASTQATGQVTHGERAPASLSQSPRRISELGGATTAARPAAPPASRGTPAAHFDSSTRLGAPLRGKPSLVDRLQQARRSLLSRGDEGPAATAPSAPAAVGAPQGTLPGEASGSVSHRRQRPGVASQGVPGQAGAVPGATADGRQLRSVLVDSQDAAGPSASDLRPPTIETGPASASAFPHTDPGFQAMGSDEPIDASAAGPSTPPAWGTSSALEDSSQQVPGNANAGRFQQLTDQDAAASGQRPWYATGEGVTARAADNGLAGPDSELRFGATADAASSMPQSSADSGFATSPSASDVPFAGQASPSDESSVLLANRSPMLSVKTLGPRTIVIGRPAGYEVVMQNSSDVPARNVEVQVHVPSWAEVVQSHATTGIANVEPDDQQDSVVRWTIPQLEGKTSEKLRLEIVPRNSRPFDLQVTWTFTPATSLAHIQVQEPKLELSISGPADIQFGQTEVYTIAVSNPGTGEAQNVVLTLLPLEPGEVAAAGQRSLGHLPPGARKTVDVELTAKQAGRLQVRATATADGDLSSEATHEVVVRRAELAVQIAGPEVQYAGSNANYSVRILNVGDAVAKDVVAAVTLPAGSELVESTPGSTVRQDNRQVIWNIGSLPPGASRSFDLTCLLNSAGENRLDVRTTGAGNLSHVESLLTHVESLADLKLVVNDPKGAVPVGTETTYEVRVINRGTKAAENVRVVGYFSEGIEPVAVSGWRGVLAEGQVQLEPIARLGAGQEMVIKITAVADRPGNHVFRAQLECVDPETRLAHEEWTRFYGESAGGVVGPESESPASTADRSGTQRLDLRR